MPAPTLPVETIQYIIQLHCESDVDKKDEIIKLTLVNRLFRQCSRRYVFRHVEIGLGSSTPECFHAVLKKQPEIRKWVEELSIRNLDDSPMSLTISSKNSPQAKRLRKAYDTILEILDKLRSAPVKKLVLVVAMFNDSPFGSQCTPQLQNVFEKTVKNFPLLEHVRVCRGLSLDLGAIRQVDSLRSLELYSTTLYPGFPALASESPKDHIPQQLDRLALTSSRESGYYDLSSEIVRFIDLSALKHLEITLDEHNEWETALNAALPLCSSSLVSLVFATRDFEQIGLLDQLESCTSLKTLRFNLVDCMTQLNSGVMQDLMEASEAMEDDEDADALTLDIFTDFKPPPSLTLLSFSFQWEPEIDDYLPKWLDCVLPSLDSAISENCDTQWRNLRSVEFQLDILDECHAPEFPLRSEHLELTRDKGVSVIALPSTAES